MKLDIFVKLLTYLTSRLKNLFLFFAFISICTIGRSEITDFRHLSIEDGLSSNFSRTIYQDSWGYIWIGSLEGLDRYDGWNVISFNELFPDKGIHISCIQEDANGHLWLGGKDGLFFWDYVSPEFITLNNDLLNDAEIGSLVMVDDVLFASTNGGLLSIDVESKSVTLVPLPQQIHDVISSQSPMCADSTSLYFAIDEAVVCYDVINHSSIVYNKSYASDGFKKSWFDFQCVVKQDQILYLGTKHAGVISFDLDLKLFSKLVPSSIDNVLTLAYNQGYLYAGTDADGLKKLDIKTNQKVSYGKSVGSTVSISSNSIRDIFIDKQQLIWLATYDEGVDFSSLEKKPFHKVKLDDQTVPFDLNIRSLFVLDDQTFVGTRRGVYVIAGKKNNFFSKKNSDLTSDIILNFCEYKGEVFFGTYGGGLYKFSKDFNRVIKLYVDVFGVECIYDMEVDKDNTLWISTLDGVYSFNEDGVLYKVLDDISVYSLHIDDNGLFWIGTMKGLFVYKFTSNKLVLHHQFSELKDVKISDIYQITDGNIWVSTNKGALEIGSEFKVLTHLLESDGLCNNSVSAIVDLTDEEILITTHKGISKYSKVDSIIESYSTSDGLAGLTFNPSAILNVGDDCLWLGNTKGTIRYDMSAATRRVDRDILLTDILVGGRSISYEGAKLINEPIEGMTKIDVYGNNNVGFRFASFPIEYATRHNFLVKLERRNKTEEWTKVINTNDVFYQNLKRGRYTFSMACSAVDGSVDMDSVKTVELLIRPKWYENTLMLLMLLFISIIMYSGLFLFGKFLKKEKGPHKYESSRLDVDHSKEILSELKDYFKTKKVYLNLELKMSDVAKDTNYSVQEISQAINQNENGGFMDFTNHYRVNEVLEKLSQPDYMKKYTLLTIAKECGFNSKSSFYRAFKKSTGKTPAEFVKSLESSD